MSFDPGHGNAACSPPEPLTTTVAVIGAGPAGCSAAIQLAQQGLDVVLIEKEVFPRFHIGESLLPACNALLQQLGVWERIKASGFVEKRGAQFRLADDSRATELTFSNGLVSELSMTYQVERAQFDWILLERAKECGVRVFEATEVKNAAPLEQGWRLSVVGKTGALQVHSQWVVDASGRKCIVGRGLGLGRESLPYPGRLAVFNHFQQVPRDVGDRGGDVVIYRLQDAWFWLIPISDTITSVGVVIQSGGRQSGESLESLFWRKVSESPALSQRLQRANAMQSFRADSDYSYSFSSFGRDRALLVGDAASFIDPVFSSGVYLALESGTLAAKAILQSEQSGREPSPRFYKAYSSAIKKQVRAIRHLIDIYYCPHGIELLLSPRPVLQVPNAVNSLLAGALAPPLRVRWRLWLFRQFYKAHKFIGIVPKIQWHQAPTERGVAE